MQCTSSSRAQAVALTIAGSDSGGNAGIQADLRAFHGFGVHGCTAIAALTAQNPAGVAGVLAVEAGFLRRQLEAVFDAYRVGGVKTGMLQHAALIDTAAAVLRRRLRAPLVVDPVMVATSGARLLEPRAVATLRRRLLPLATIVTPNLPEAGVLLGRPLRHDAAAQAAARELAARFGCAVLLKGGHDPAHPSADLLCLGGELLRIVTPVVRAPLSTHGTGCTLSAALAASLATGRPLLDAVIEAKAFVYRAIRGGRTLGPDAAVLGMVRRGPTAAVHVTRLGAPGDGSRKRSRRRARGRGAP
jgi:hydroxymethylpyrimidine/phosphomethylpyrimidine kinase